MLSELFNMKNGYTPSTSNASFWNFGNIPWFRMDDIRDNGGILSDASRHVTPEAVKGGLFPAGTVIVATSATVGAHALITVDFLANQRFTCLTVKDKYKDMLLPKFVYYYCFKLDEWCLNNTHVSSFPSVDMTRFGKFLFPVPPLDEQRRIVSILDKFSALVSDISSGLPAEIAARRKQDEYYRDRLLNFKEAES